MNKLSILFYILITYNFDIFVVSETWLSSDMFDNEIMPPGYCVYRNDRSSRGGGVAIYVKLSCPSSLLFSQDSFEGIYILISSSLDISCVYVPPASDFSYILALLDFITNLKIKHCHLVLGDFNMPDICWDSMTAKSVGSNLFCEAILNINLCQLVREPTHIKGNILDLVLSDVPECVYDVKIMNETYSSDHYLISLTYSMHSRANSFKSGTSYRLSFNWSQADWEGLTDYLFDTDFSRCFVLDDVNKSWKLIRDEILTACRRFIPTSRPRNINRLPWFTLHIVHTINKIIRTLRRSPKSKQSSSILSKIET